MKIYFILFVLIFSSCSEKNLEKFELHNQDSINIYLKLAANEKLSFSGRKKSAYRAEQLLLSQARDSINLNNLLNIAHNYYNLYDIKGLRRILDAVNENTLDKTDFQNLGEVFLLKEMYYQDISLNDSAYYYCLKAEKVFAKLDNKAKICKIIYHKAAIKYFVNDYLGSDKDLFEALKIAKSIKLYDMQLCIYILASLNSFDLEEYDKALTYDYKSLKIMDENPSLSKRKAHVYALIGNAFLKKGNATKAMFYFKKGLEDTSLKVFDPKTYTYILDNLGQALMALGKFPEVPAHHFEAAVIRDSLDIDYGKNFNRLYLSEYYLIINDTSHAFEYGNEAFQLSKRFNAPNDMLLSLKQLSKVEPANELKYAKQYIRISDSMQQLERQTRNKFAKIAYETEEITEEKNTAVLHKWILFSVAVAISIFAFLLLVIRSQKSKQRKLEFLQVQQKSNEEIYHLIQTQQRKIDEGRQIEKRRIAQDLHDGVMNKLASTRFNLHVITKTDQSGIFEKCQPFINGIQDVEKEIRNIAHDLNNDVFAENYSFINALNLLFEDFQIITAVNWHVEIDNNINWEIIKSADKIHIYRIFQEALQNIVKHANANNIIIKIALQDEHLIIEIYDDGDGFSSNAKKKGIGLQNITSRANQCGGIVDIKSNGGTFIRITMPRPTQTNINNDKH